MKKLVAIILIALSLLLCACSERETVEEKPNVPKAFSILQKETVLRKHTKKGSETTFAKEEFESLLGEALTRITVNALPEKESGTLLSNGKEVIKGQTLPFESLDFLKFVPETSCETATFSFTSDGAGYNGSEFCCNIVYGDSVNTAPVIADSEIKTVEGISCEGKLDITEPNGDEFTINVLTYPKEGEIDVDGNGKIVYTPNDGFSGRDLMVYTVTDSFGLISSRASVTISVAENEKNINFADMQDNINHIYAHKMCDNDTMVYRYENGKYYFDPEIPVSKIDFLVMLMSVTGDNKDIVAVADSIIDDDNGLSSGLKGYLSAASEKGIIKLNNGKFSPNEKITLSEASFMIAESLKLPSALGNDGNPSSLAAVAKSGIIDVSKGVIDGSKTLTKSEIACLLCACEDYMTKNNIFLKND